MSADVLQAHPGVEARARTEAGPGLYVHVPFCAVRCHYCDFSSGALSSDAIESWLGAIEREMVCRARLARGVRFRSVFFGGGTPSALSSRHFQRLWSALRGSFEIAPGAEITLEANPESVRPALLEAWRGAGVNRLSFGVQSFDDAELERLGRIHDATRARRAFALARDAGFENLSLDLMYGFPGHTLERWRSSIAQALDLGPDHLSGYNYGPEDGTPMGDAVARRETALPDEHVQALMYEALRTRTSRAGFVHYEISNFARPGRASRHNLCYWLRRDYVGLGPSAHSHWRGRRWGNVYAARAYADRVRNTRSPVAECERRSPSEAVEEVVFLGLRLMGGLRFADYDPEVRQLLERRFRPALEDAVRLGKLRRVPGGYALPDRALFVSDDVFAWLLASAARRPAPALTLLPAPA